jgi:hypothetical protein
MKSSSTSAARKNPVEEPLACPTCPSCDEGRALVYGTHADDGIVRCAQCAAPLFYCDLGGQG